MMTICQSQSSCRLNITMKEKNRKFMDLAQLRKIKFPRKFLSIRYCFLLSFEIYEISIMIRTF